MLLLWAEFPKASRLRAKAKVLPLSSYSLFLPLANLYCLCWPSPHTRHSPAHNVHACFPLCLECFSKDKYVTCPSLPFTFYFFLKLSRKIIFKCWPLFHQMSSLPAIYFCSQHLVLIKIIHIYLLIVFYVSSTSKLDEGKDVSYFVQ